MNKKHFLKVFFLINSQKNIMLNSFKDKIFFIIYQWLMWIKLEQNDFLI